MNRAKSTLRVMLLARIGSPTCRLQTGRPWLSPSSRSLPVADIGEFAVVNKLFAEAFPADPPARMTMLVPLPKGLLISIGCVARGRRLIAQTPGRTGHPNPEARSTDRPFEQPNGH